MLRFGLFARLLAALAAVMIVAAWIGSLGELSIPSRMVLLLLIAAGVSGLIARSIGRPLDGMRRAAQAQAGGEIEVEWPIPTTREMRELSNAVQTMALNLQDKIRTIENLLAEQRSIFDSMAEGLIVVDPRERILDANRAAQQMLQFDIASVRGRDMLEVVRNARLANLARRALREEAPLIEGSIMLFAGSERQIQVRGSLLRAGGRVKGALLVLSDVTRLRRLESIQTEFVANASHELKTPVTSIKGFAETIASEDMPPDQIKRYCRIIARHADQLGTLIDDLLELARLEHEEGRGPLNLAPTPVTELIEGAVETCAADASRKNIRIERVIPPDLLVQAHALFLQRAIFNLLDNAVKYSPAHSTIRVIVERTDSEVLIHVRDEGPGIAPEHHERIFERFYRVDKSRSRKLGGTGLGLSIAKHLVEAHGGRITLVSAPGQGSTFTIHLPLPPPPPASAEGAPP